MWREDPPTIYLKGWERGSPEDDAEAEREAELAAQVEAIKAMFYGSENWDLEAYEGSEERDKGS